MKNLYEINSEIDRLIDEAIDEETGEISEENFDKLTALELRKEELVKHIALKYKGIVAFTNAIADEIKRLQADKKRLEKLQERIESYVANNVDGKTEGVGFKITFRESEAVEVDEFADLPKLHTLMPEIVEKRIEFKVDKTAAKKLIKTGINISGLTLVKRNNISIK